MLVLITALRRLPRYSPFFNITENAISCVKAAAKRAILAEIQNVDIAKENQITLHEHRSRILERVIVPYGNKCQQWSNHSMRYVQRAINLD